MGRGHHGECGIQESHKYVLARGWGWGEGRKKGQMGDCQVVLSFQAIGSPHPRLFIFYFRLTEK